MYVSGKTSAAITNFLERINPILTKDPIHNSGFWNMFGKISE